jgi:copper chaperone CopZ
VAFKRNTYPVLGMTCAACVRKIERVLDKTEGIKKVSVNFASENVSFDYDDRETSIEKIASILKDMGYEMLT